MDKFWHHWVQGWKLQLIMLIFNIVLAVLFVPLAIILYSNETIYYLVATVLYIMIMIPMGGKLMAVFPAKDPS